METLELTQEELKIIIAVFNQVTIKISDAVLMIPIAEKINAKVHPEVTTPPVSQPEGQAVLDSAPTN